MDGKVVEVGSLHLQRGQQVMVWIRDLEKLGWGTIETPQPDRISLKAKSVTLTFIKGQGVALVNSLAVRLPIDTYMRAGQFMVPLSFVAKALGYQFDLAVKPVVTIGTASAPDRGRHRGEQYPRQGHIRWRGCPGHHGTSS
jgi:hypothetical protein